MNFRTRFIYKKNYSDITRAGTERISVIGLCLYLYLTSYKNFTETDRQTDGQTELLEQHRVLSSA